MWQSDFAEREGGFCLCAGRVAPAVRRADCEQQLVRAVRPVIFKEIRDLFRGKLLAAGVEQDQDWLVAGSAPLDQL